MPPQEAERTKGAIVQSVIKVQEQIGAIRRAESTGG
jgi:hypothetical protein